MKYERVNATPLLASVFSGAGGLDVGFSQAGFETIFAADHSAAAVNSFNRNAKRQVAKKLDLASESSVSIAKQIEQACMQEGRSIDGLIGGPPCQGVSAANNSSDPADSRNQLFSRYVTLVNRLHNEQGLKFFVFENVPGLKLRKNQALYRGILNRLGENFDVTEEIVEASGYGVAQLRRRLILVGVRKELGKRFKFPGPTHPAPISVKHVIGNLPPPDFFDRKDPRCKSEFHENHWTSRAVSTKFHGESAFETPPNSRSFIRLAWDKPSRTVAYGNREIHLHPDGRRRLSIYEAMQLQGFPSEFVLEGNFSEQVTQVSNAVPPPVAKAIAKKLREVLY